jgi:hypothetical protein
MERKGDQDLRVRTPSGDAAPAAVSTSPLAASDLGFTDDITAECSFFHGEVFWMLSGVAAS